VDDDRELVRLAVAGDRAATEQLLSRHLDMVTTLCRRLCGQDADDAVQQSLIAIVRGLPRFDGRSRFSTWCYRVTTNASLDELRRRARRPVPTDDATLGVVLEDRAGRVQDLTAERIDIDAALATLAWDFRAAVVLRDLCGLDYDEIGEVLEVPPGTVRSRIARGRRALSDRLGNPTASGDV
jgi:RNA polymerase sigma-70 factor (ECF subfamily)